MKQITTFILLLALCVCTDAAAQRSVRLTVLEKGTEQPVIAANVAYADNPETEERHAHHHGRGRTDSAEACRER